MIDIHSHILPGMDNGAGTEAESIMMAKQAVAQGIHTIIATPHHQHGQDENTKEEIIKYTHIFTSVALIKTKYLKYP